MLALAYYYAPCSTSGSIRNTRLLSRLAELKLDVRVITVAGDYWEKQGGAILDAGSVAGLRVDRTRTSFPLERFLEWTARFRPNHPSGDSASDGACAGIATAPLSAFERWKDLVTYSLGWPDQNNGWLPHALRCALEVCELEMPDLIYAIGQPWTAFLVGLALKLKTGKPLVIDFMDPWGSRVWDERKPRLIRALDRYAERFLVRHADLIIANTSELRDDFIHRVGVPADKVEVVTCGFDRGDFRGLRRFPRNEQLVITHIGNLYGGRNPYAFLNAVRDLVSEGRIPANEIRVQFLGGMDIEDPRLGVLQADPILRSTVVWHGPVTHRQALEALAGSSAALLIQPGHGLAIPAKLYEYVALAKPVFAIADPGSAVARIMTQEGWGEAVDNDNPRQIRSSLLALYERYRRNRLQGFYTEESVNRYEIGNLAAGLAKLLRRTIDSR